MNLARIWRDKSFQLTFAPGNERRRQITQRGYHGKTLSSSTPGLLSAVRIATDTYTHTVSLPIVGKNYRPGMRLVALILSATDDASGVDSVLVSNEGDFAGAQWQAYATGLDWWVSDKGTTTVYVKYRDRAGNESQAYSATTTAP